MVHVLPGAAEGQYSHAHGSCSILAMSTQTVLPLTDVTDEQQTPVAPASSDDRSRHGASLMIGGRHIIIEPKCSRVSRGLQSGGASPLRSTR